MQKSFKRVLAVALACVLLASMCVISVSAYSPGTATTHTVFKHTESTLAPGVEQYVNYAYANDGEQNVYFVTTADISRDDVVVQTSYMNQYRNKTLGMSKLTNQVASANEYYSDPSSPQFISEYYNVVAGVNASFYNMTTGQPNGICWIDGVDFGTNSYPAFFAITTDGDAVIDDRANVGNYNIWQAVGGSQWLVRNGADVTASVSGDYNTDRHCRTAVGITAEGKVVTMVLDGRQSPYSIGGSMHEIAQIMLEADCVAAINLDGGGSSTYVARPEGEDSVQIVNRPSDGSERNISAGLIIASTAAPSNVFDRATLTADDEYITVNASTKINAKGISPAGTSADIPAEATFTTDNGTVAADGTFTPAQLGDATIQMVYNNEVVGETVVHVVDPTKVAFNITTLAVPYGKNADIDLHLYYGEFEYEVKYVPQDVNIVISNNALGSVRDLTFYATSDNTVTGSATISATSVAVPTLSAAIPLVVGKGSEVLFDFEDQDVAGWSGGDMYNAGVVTNVSAVTPENGMVHSGDYAMAYNMDFSQLTYYEDYIASKMCYNADVIASHGTTTDAEGIQQRGATEDYVDITGAVALGFWVYLPDEISVAAFDPDFRIGGKKTATSAWAGCNGYLDEICDSDGLLITNGDTNKAGWYYFNFDLSSFSNYYALRLQNCRLSNSTTKNGKTIEWNGDILTWYITDAAWKKAGIKSYNSNLTLYIDDITVDYSSVVADREAPVFSSPTYAFAGASDAIALNNNATIANNELEFAVSVAEDTTKTNASGLDASSAKVYIDGVEAEATYKNGKIAVDETEFADGVHTVMFEMADRTGNTSHLTRTFTVNAGSGLDTIKVVARDADLDSTLVGSLYYIDLVATDISAVDSASVTLKVNNVNDWEPQGIETAEGFTASYTPGSYDKGIIDLTVTRTGDNSATGEAVIASIPVRTWYPHNALGKNSNWIITSKKCVYPMDTQVFTKAGSVVFTDGSTTTFSAAEIQVDSEAMCPDGKIGINKGNETSTVVTSWHEHNAQPVEDKPATCTEDGFSGRTFCEECNSVVDWGTVMPATGHTYDFVDGVLKCVDCNELFNGEYTDGKTYADGVALQGFVDGKYYIDGVAQDYTGVVLVDGKYYEFNDEHVSQGLYTGSVKIDDEYGYAQNGELVSGWIYDNGDWYFIYHKTMRAVPERTIGYPESTAVVTYQFEETGKVISGAWVEMEEGTRYYYGPDFYKLSSYVHANVANVQFEVIDGETYGFNKMGYRYEGMCFLRESNSDLKLYEFTDEGVLVGLYTGIYEGKYYANGVVTGGIGLINVGNDYYYVKSSGALFKDGTLNVSAANANGLLPAGNYKFDAEGKLVLRNGIINGYYYEDGVVVKGKGMIEIDGDYYYIGQKGQVVMSQSLYLTADQTNGYFPAGNYKFDDEGKLVLRNGIVNGYYYEDGVLIKGKGMIKVGEEYYYIGQKGQVVTSQSLYLSEDQTNGYFPAGNYKFDENGVLVIKQGVVNGYYYIDGVLTKNAHLVMAGGDFYYIGQRGQAYVGSIVITEANTNGLLPAGRYTFGDDGKMIDPPVSIIIT